MKKILLLVIAIVTVGFSSCGKKQDKPVVNENVVSVSKNITIAFIDTDTLFANYDFVKDIKNEIEKTDKKLSGDLQSKAKQFQTEYENYLKVGATMTLTEQKKKEAVLTEQRQSLGTLEQRYGEQLMTLRDQRNREAQDKIFDFIDKYNKEHDNYTIIYSKSRTSGVLYSPKDSDITKEVLIAINEEYAKTKKK